jgi:octaprenyl-diphosphate synthase
MMPRKSLVARWVANPVWADLSALYSSIQADMDKVESQLAAWSRSDNPLISEISRYVLQKRGKRFRPALVLLSSRLFSSRDGEDVFLASLVEMIHTASLIHDDIIDNARTRRGVESVHARWGPNITVLLGDYLYIKSIGLSLQAKDDRIIGILMDISARMIEGELAEYAMSGDTGISEDEYLGIIGNKTAALFSTCCRLGAILGRASPEEENDVAEYGRNLGMCFQIIDDLLDITGDEKTLGKPTMLDLGEGRITLPLIHTLHHDGHHPHRLISALVHRKDVNGEERRRLLEILKECGSLEYTRQKAHRFSERSLEFLTRFPDSEVRETLAGLARFAYGRDR